MLRPIRAFELPARIAISDLPGLAWALGLTTVVESLTAFLRSIPDPFSTPKMSSSPDELTPLPPSFLSSFACRNYPSLRVDYFACTDYAARPGAY